MSNEAIFIMALVIIFIVIMFSRKIRNATTPPCAACKRYEVERSEYYEIDHVNYHYCNTNRKHPIGGDDICYSCEWYRYTPFCKFESKDAE